MFANRGGWRWEKGDGGWLAAAAAGGWLAWQVMRELRAADLRGQVAAVTGGSRSLGLLLAREFARLGCRIAICARDELELERARNDLARRGAEVIIVPADVADRDEAEHFVAEVMRQYGSLDILVNNAGVIQVGPVQAMTLADFDEAMNVMYWGLVYPTLAVLPQMLVRRRGRIVNITSIGGKISIPHLLPYNSAKFAAVGFSEGLRAELAGEGVVVTTIVPGLMRTGSYLNAYFKGGSKGEFTWFGLGASLPFLTMDAERAARLIVRAVRRGEAERILSIPANLLARFHALFPGLTADLLGLVQRLLLPKPATAQADAARGMELQEAVASPLLRGLTGLGIAAARRYHEFPGPQVDRSKAHVAQGHAEASSPTAAWRPAGDLIEPLEEGQRRS